MSFNFRLQRVLEYKETMEELKKTEYGEAIYRLGLAEEELEDIRDKKVVILKYLNLSNDSLKVGELRRYNNYLEDLNIRIELKKKEVVKLEQKVSEAQEELLLAAQEKKSFEKLKENDFDKFLDEEKKKEAKEVDEIVTFKSKKNLES